jgi:hypothetical protein
MQLGQCRWGSKLFYVRAGRTGPPLLLCHGFGVGSYHFDRNISELAKTHRVSSSCQPALGISHPWRVSTRSCSASCSPSWFPIAVSCHCLLLLLVQLSPNIHYCIPLHDEHRPIGDVRQGWCCCCMTFASACARCMPLTCWAWATAGPPTRPASSQGPCAIRLTHGRSSCITSSQTRLGSPCILPGTVWVRGSQNRPARAGVSSGP